MPLNPAVEPGERLYAEGSYCPSRDAMPYAFAVSDRAVFTLAKKRGFVRDDPWYMQRLPLSKVRRVSLRRVSPIGAYILAGILVIGGIAVTILMFAPVFRGEGGVIKFAPLAGVIFGVAIAAAAKGKKAIVLDTTEGTRIFKPPTSLSGINKDTIAKIQSDFLAGCKEAGLRVEDAG